MGQVFTDITLKNAGDITLTEHGYKQEQEIRYPLTRPMLF